MALLTLLDASLAYGHVALLDHAAMSLEAGERIGLIGRNGTGKSSLLKILAGLELPDDGTLQVQANVRRYYVPQEPQFEPGISVFDAVSVGVAEARSLRERYEAHADGDDLDDLGARIGADEPARRLVGAHHDAMAARPIDADVAIVAHVRRRPRIAGARRRAARLVAAEHVQLGAIADRQSVV